MTIDHEFEAWLAGFTDGEGCFWIYRRTKPSGAARYTVGFSIGARIDDRPVIEAIHRYIGHGGVYYRPGSARRDQQQPQAILRIESHAGCRALVAIFDRHPLRAKKAGDYAIWRQAVEARAAIRIGRGCNNDWAPFAELADQLRDGRRIEVAA